MKFSDGQSEFSWVPYLISRLYATREIRKNYMRAKN